MQSLQAKPQYLQAKKEGVKLSNSDSDTEQVKLTKVKVAGRSYQLFDNFARIRLASTPKWHRTADGLTVCLTRIGRKVCAVPADRVVL